MSELFTNVQKAKIRSVFDRLERTIEMLNDKKGFPSSEITEDKHAIPSKLCLIHSEVSEALEDYRIGSMDHLLEELADIIIRTLDLSHSLYIHSFTSEPIGRVIIRVLEKGSVRPYKHDDKVI